jgi:hypothetical protein
VIVTIELETDEPIKYIKGFYQKTWPVDDCYSAAPVKQVQVNVVKAEGAKKDKK